MSDSWGNLKEGEKRAIAERARTLSEEEINERFIQYDDRVTFRISRKTDKTLAGPLDVEFEETDRRLAADEPVEVSTEDDREDEIVEITLISPEDFEYEPEITKDDQKAARPIDQTLKELKDYFAKDTGVEAGTRSVGESAADLAGLPAVIDHRNSQSPVKDQYNRGTCVAHASMGLLESFAHIPDDLSEQHAHYKFNEFLGRAHHFDAGLKTTDAAPFLARANGRVCLEADWPYIVQQSTINTLVTAGAYGPPPAAVNNEDYGIGAYKIITDKGLTGESIKNTRYLEALLYKGYDVVIGTYVSWDDNNNDGILDPVLDPSGKPVSKAGHAMLVVGYDRSQQYFVVKNSWAAGWGHNGYAYLHYDLVRSCFKYGFVVDSVVPPAATQLPSKIAQAPYSAARISRASLRAAVLFIKTSRGRFAVCEAYAGYNLYLRNLRVYNADGSPHLEKDSLVIRGTYLCDIDSGHETSSDADFWWQAVRPGVNFLVPRNGATACIAFNLAALGPQQIDAVSLNSAPVPTHDLDYAVVVGRTTANRRFKMLVHARPNDELRISYLELYKPDGRRYKYARDISVASSWTYNLDTLRRGGGRYADIWWHVISSGAGFLERYSTAKTGHVWNL